MNLLTKDNPARPPDWRWKRAIQIIDNNTLPPSRTRDGVSGFKWIKQAIAFREQYLEANDIRHHMILAENFPEIYYAHAYYISLNDPKKSSLEAHILARETDHEIARGIGSTVETVTAYEALFFNVRDRLDYEQYIVHNVIRPKLVSGSHQDDDDYILKLYGYFQGPVAVRAFENNMVNPTWQHEEDKFSSALRDDTTSTTNMKIAIAAKTTPVNRETQIPFLEMFVKIVELSQQADSADKAQSQLLDSVQSMLSGLPLRVGAEEVGKNNPMAAFDTASIELGYNEMMRVSLTQRLPGGEDLQGLTFESVTNANNATTIVNTDVTR